MRSVATSTPPSTPCATATPRPGRAWSASAWGSQGIVEQGADGEQTLYAQSLGWPAVPVRQLVTHDIAVFAENGAKTEAMAEVWDGAARGVDETLVVLLGRGWDSRSSATANSPTG